MAVAVNEPVIHSLTSTGAASYAAIPLRIIDAGSVRLFANAIEVDSANFSVSAITIIEPYTFTLNLSPVIPTAEDILIIQDYPVEREADMSPGQQLTSASYNTSLDNVTLMVKDQAYIQDATNMRYALGVAGSVTDAMKEIPIPTGEDNSLVWSTTGGFSWSPNHPGGQTIGEFKAELAAEGGAALVGYNTGAGASTVQAQVATNVTGIATNTAAIPAIATNTAAITANTTAITANTTASATNATNIATNLTTLNTLTATATESASGADHITFWASDVATPANESVQEALVRALGNQLIFATKVALPWNDSSTMTISAPGVTAADYADGTLSTPPATTEDSGFDVVAAEAGAGEVTLTFSVSTNTVTGAVAQVLVWRH